MKMTSESFDRCMCRVLCDKTLLVAGGAVCYRLLENPPQYLVECVFRGASILLPVGQRFSTAAEIYERLVRGEVTPCTAGDIVEDMQILWE